MHPSDEELRNKEPTYDGRHLHMPDGYPHASMARLVAIVVGLAMVVGFLGVVGGTAGVILGGLALVVIVVPFAVSRLNRAAQRERKEEVEDELRAEDLEHSPPRPPPAYQRR